MIACLYCGYISGTMAHPSDFSFCQMSSYRSHCRGGTLITDTGSELSCSFVPPFSLFSGFVRKMDMCITKWCQIICFSNSADQEGDERAWLGEYRGKYLRCFILQRWEGQAYVLGHGKVDGKWSRNKSCCNSLTSTNECKRLNSKALARIQR